MPSIIQINVTANSGSTGRIAEQINQMAGKKGWKTYLAYGRNMQPCQSELIHVGNMLQVYEHYAEHRIFDNDGLASRLATRQLIGKIKEIKPDVIHLHNIHDHWLNYRILFEYLNTLDTPIVWTQHDCWSFTGGCGHYTMLKCDKWRTTCDSCSMKNRRFEKTRQHFLLKNELFSATKNMVLTPVSHWLESQLKESFLNCHEIRPISNGVDIEVFRPTDSAAVRERYGINDSPYLVASATSWSTRKGLKDYVALSKIIDKGVKIVLVGLSQKQIEQISPYGIVCIPRTESASELAALYSGGEIVMNLSYEETFGLTTVEGFACGTPSIVYNSTASPELITSDTGIVVAPGDIKAVNAAVRQLMTIGKENYSSACRKRAVTYYNIEDCCNEYLDLYEELIAKKCQK